MNYQFIVLILIASLAITNAQTCADNPIADLLAKWGDKNSKNVGRSREERAGLNQASGKEAPPALPNMLEVIDAFKQRTPAIVNDLTFCDQYNGESSCCTDDLVKLIPLMARGFAKGRSEKPPKPMRILRQVYDGLLACSSSTKAQAFNNTETFKDIRKSYQKCFEQGNLATEKLFFGTACAICIDPAKVADYFIDITDSNPELIVQTSNLEEYERIIQISLKCFDEVNLELSNAVEQALIDLDLATDFDTDCDQVVERTNNFLADPNQFTFAQKDCKSQISFFGGGCADNQSDNGTDTDLDLDLETPLEPTPGPQIPESDCPMGCRGPGTPAPRPGNEGPGCPPTCQEGDQYFRNRMLATSSYTSSSSGLENVFSSEVSGSGEYTESSASITTDIEDDLEDEDEDDNDSSNSNIILVNMSILISMAMTLL